MSDAPELVDTNEMVVVHRVFRRERRLLSELILYRHPWRFSKPDPIGGQPRCVRPAESVE